MGKCYLFFIIFGIMCYACARTPDKKLAEAKSQMETAPAEALKILQSMDTRSLSRKENALYSLLYVQALDKNVLPQKSDSLVRIALDYYEGRKPSVELARAYYYLGCYFVEYSMQQEAIRVFLQAEKIARPLQEWNLLGLIYGRLNNEYTKQQDWINSLKMSYLLLDCFRKAGNVKNEYLGYLGMSLIFWYSSQLDSCKFYNRKALQGLAEIRDSTNYATALLLETNIHLWENELAKAKASIKEAERYFKDSADLQLALTMAVIYKSEGKTDSARWALKRLLNKRPGLTEPGIYYVLASIEEQDANLEKAFGELKKSFYLQDSLYKNNMEHSVYRYAQLYNKGLAEAEKQKLSIRNHFMLAGLLLLLVLSLLLYFIYKNRLNRRDKEVAEARIRIRETEDQISKFKGVLRVIDKENKSNSRDFFLRQMQMLKELAQANTKNVHNEKKRNEEIHSIREKYLFGEDWVALKTGVNMLYKGIAEALETRYKGRLSEQEIKICILSCCGFSVQEIAAYLRLSDKTVYNLRSHTSKILSPGKTESLEKILREMIDHL